MLPAAAGKLLLGNETALPNTATLGAGAATLPADAALVPENATVPGTLVAGAAVLPPAATGLLLGTVTLLPNTDTLGPAGETVACDRVLLDGNTALPAAVPATDETLPFDEALLTGEAVVPAGAATLLAALVEMLVPAAGSAEVDEMPANETLLPARSMMPSPLKSAATTFLLSASIRVRSIAGCRVVRPTDCA